MKKYNKILIVFLLCLFIFPSYNIVYADNPTQVPQINLNNDEEFNKSFDDMLKYNQQNYENVKSNVDKQMEQNKKDFENAQNKYKEQSIKVEKEGNAIMSFLIILGILFFFFIIILVIVIIILINHFNKKKSMQNKEKSLEINEDRNKKERN